jgi:hypothetical protein
MRPDLLLPVCAAALAAVACSATSSPVAAPSPTSRTPRPVRTVIRNTHVVHPGHAVRLDAQRGVALRLRATGPEISRTSLSSTHGYPPSHGYYVTFRVSIANVGRQPVGVGPGDFAVVVGGRGRVTSYDGNSPYSGAGRQLDPTELLPGDVVRAPLTFDVRSRHGRLGYYPDRTAAVTWVY